MTQKTPLYDAHVAMNAKIVNFGGWEMPINYGSQVKEHKQVRADVGMFDVSHMTIIDLQGDNVRDFLRYLLANNIDRLQQTGKALYSCMLNEKGGVIDDLIVYFLADHWFRMVTNANTRDKDLAWIEQQAQAYAVTQTVRDDLAMIAIQGPHSHSKTLPLLNQSLRQATEQLPPFCATWDEQWFIARTGYTGEDGFEIMLPNEQAATFWQQLNDAGVAPIGLGARDTLRLEAAMNLYGTDMDENITPLESGLTWTIAWEPHERDFIGRKPLEQKRTQVDKLIRVGLVLEGKGVIRNHQNVLIDGVAEGVITSGSFSPTLNKAIAMARIPAGKQGDFSVEIRGKQHPVKVVKLPFVRNGKPSIDL